MQQAKLWSALGLSVLVGVGAAGTGLYLANGDPQSLIFVAIAVVVWALFTVGLGWYGLLLRRLGLEIFEENGRWADARRAAERHPTRSRAQLVREHAPPELTPGSWLPSGQAVLVSLGLFGTFFGLSQGLRESIPCIDPNDAEHAACVTVAVAEAAGSSMDGDTLAMQRGMSVLLGGARTAFSKSVAGIGLGMSYLLLWRLAERRRAELLHRAERRLEERYPYVSPEQEQGDKLLQALNRLAERQVDGAQLTQAAGQLSEGAGALSRVGVELQSVSKTLGDFKAETIAVEVGRGVREAVEERLAPTLDQISRELKILHDMKREQDEVVRNQLRELVGQLRDEALTPMARTIEQSNAQTRQVATSVQALSGTVERSTQAVQASSIQMQALAGQLETFQQQALRDLGAFAGELKVTLADFTRDSGASFQQMGADIRGSVQAAERAMEGQRAAFSASADEARQAFSSQTTALRQAGEVASNEIRLAGTEAREALREVREEFSGTLAHQHQALKAILDELESSFKRDLDTRKEFEQRSDDALRRLEKLMATSTAKEESLREVYAEARRTLGGALQDHGRQLSEQREQSDRIARTLQENIEKLSDNHRQFLTAEDKHLSDVLGRLYQVANAISVTTSRLQRTP